MEPRLEVALTFDVEFNKPSIIRATGSLYSGIERMPAVVDLLRSAGAPATWYIAHDADAENRIACLYPRLVESMASRGEIGCHFHFHEGRRVRTDEAFQRRGIGEATRFLRSLGHEVTSFRGGNGYLDAVTLRVLADLGFTTDSSVVPGLREVSPEGLVTDHTRRRSCVPYHPLEGDPWSEGGSGLLEVPIATDTLLDLRTPVVSVLVNRVVGINNLVLVDPDGAARRVEAMRRSARSDRLVLALSAHPYDFLENGGSREVKLERLERFVRRMQALPDAQLTTMSAIRASWVPSPARAPRPAVRSLIEVTTSDLRRARRRLRGALSASRGGDV